MGCKIANQGRDVMFRSRKKMTKKNKNNGKKLSLSSIIFLPLIMICKVMSKMLAKGQTIFVFIWYIGTINSIVKQVSRSYILTTCAKNDNQTTRLIRISSFCLFLRKKKWKGFKFSRRNETGDGNMMNVCSSFAS